MLKVTCWCAALILGLSTAFAKEFPLEFKTLKASELTTFPAGYGASGTIHRGKPEGIKKESKAVSKNPLYGQFGNGREDGPVLFFRLDESKGDRKGYDTLIIDMNQNGDLTDDPVVKRQSSFFEVKPLKPDSQREELRFGPIPAPADKMLGKYRPQYYVEAFLYLGNMVGSDEPRSQFVGTLRLKAGWYLETVVQMDGIKQKIGLFDTDGDMQIGQRWTSMTYTSDNKESWYFRPGDSFLIDANHSGEFENNPLNTESCAFADVLYLASKPYKVSLVQGSKALQVEPWSGQLAEVSLQPRGDQVRNVSLAWEYKTDKWELIRPNVENGKILVPPGNYRLYQCLLVPPASVKEQVMAMGHKYTMSKPFQFEAGKTNTLLCGPPLEILVTAEKDNSPQFVTTTNISGKRVMQAVTGTNMLRINGVVTGSGGEIYSSYGKGKDFKDDPQEPTYSILAANGKTLTSGNLEFG